MTQSVVTQSVVTRPTWTPWQAARSGIRGRVSGLGVLPVALLAAFLFTGCSGNKEPELLPSQTTTQMEPQLEAPPPMLPMPPMPPVRELKPTRRSKVTVIEPGKGKNGNSLLEASRLAKQQQAQGSIGGGAAVQINDDNLSEYAKGGSVIVIDGNVETGEENTESTLAGQPVAAASSYPSPPPTQTVSAPAPGNNGNRPVYDAAGRRITDQAQSNGNGRDPASTTPVAGPEDETWWRNRALDLRTGWRRTLDRLDELELESAALRQQFYDEDDLFVRDTQIKPAWDRVLDRLATLREEADSYEDEVEDFLTRGRSVGALPGWLREGWELEPTPEERERLQKVGLHRTGEVEDTVQAIDIDTLEDNTP